MKKRIICILLALMLINAPVVSFAEEFASDGFDLVLFEDDFEDAVYDGNNTINNATKNATWSVRNMSLAESKARALYTYEAEDSERGMMGLAHYDENDGTANAGGKRIYTAPSSMAGGVDLVKYEFDVNVPLNARRYFRYTNNGTVFLEINCYNGNDYIRLFDGKATGEKVSYTPGTWVGVCVVIDAAGGTSDLYIDGVYQNSLTFTNTSAAKAATGFDTDTVKVTVSSQPEPVLIDNMKITAPSPLGVETVLPADGATDFPRKDGKIEIVCNRNIFDFDDKTVVVTDSFEVPVTTTATIEDNKFIVTFDEMLSPGENYTVTYGDESYSFSTASDMVIATAPVVTDRGDGKFLASTEVENTSEDYASAALIIAVYDSKNTMVLSICDDNEEIASGAKPTLSVSAEIPAEEGETYSAKAFVVNNMTELKMLRSDFSGQVFTYSGSGASAFSDDFLVGVNGENISISGHTELAGERVILISVKEPDGSINHLAPVKTDEDGFFSYTFAPDSENNGLWTITLSGRKIVTVQKSINFISPATQNAIMAQIENADSAEDIKTVFATESNKAALNIDSKYFTENAYQIILEQKDTFAEFKDIGDIFIEAQSVLDGVCSASWSSLSAYISENEDILMNGVSEYDYYKKLSETEQNVINKKIKGEYSSIMGFRAAFAEKTEDYKDSKSSRPSGGGSGGGGGGGSLSPSATIITDKMPSTSVIEEETPSTNQVNPEKSEFPDMKEALWAKAGVTFLKEKGIVSGDDNGNFRPLDSVKREEFVKMIAEAFGISTQNSECQFTDADKNSWYAKYLTALNEAQIISGRPDGSFGVGENISRQDMAVMLYRALLYKNKSAAKINAAQFIDKSAISSYALDAVSELYAMGLISGMGDGSFKPLDTANRAQASTIIFNMFDKGVIE